MIKKANINDVETIASLAILMWKQHTIQDLIDEFSNIISTGKAQFFLKYYKDIPIGFAQCQLRYDYVEGTKSQPVGYLEGIFIKKEYRNKGYAKELLSEYEKWAQKQGCSEFASDCELSNLTGFNFHINMGFIETNRIICFTKQL